MDWGIQTVCGMTKQDECVYRMERGASFSKNEQLLAETYTCCTLKEITY